MAARAAQIVLGIVYGSTAEIPQRKAARPPTGEGTPMYRSLQSLINPRRACAARVTVVGSQSVSLSVAASRLSVRSTNDATYLAGNENQFNRRISSDSLRFYSGRPFCARKITRMS